MFNITENSFTDRGVCKYTDEHNNTAFFRRTDDGFVGRLRFADEKVTAAPVAVKIPVIDDTEGTKLHLEYLDGKEHKTVDVLMGINGFTELIQRWIYMLYDIKSMEMDNSLLLKVNECNNITLEDVYMQKLAILEQYEELIPFLQAIFRQ